MKRLKTWQAGLRIMLASSLVGTVFQAGCLGTIARNFNPCGTILACDPVEWDLMFHDYPDWDIDPTCTIPGLCDGNWPPSSGDDTGTASTTTTTGTTTTGTTTTGTTTTGYSGYSGYSSGGYTGGYGGGYTGGY